MSRAVKSVLSLPVKLTRPLFILDNHLPVTQSMMPKSTGLALPLNGFPIEKPTGALT